MKNTNLLCSILIVVSAVSLIQADDETTTLMVMPGADNIRAANPDATTTTTTTTTTEAETTTIPATETTTAADTDSTDNNDNEDASSTFVLSPDTHDVKANIKIHIKQKSKGGKGKGKSQELPSEEDSDESKEKGKLSEVEMLSQNIKKLGGEMACHYVSFPSVYHHKYGCFVIHENPMNWENAFSNCARMRLRQKKGRLAHVRDVKSIKAVAERIKLLIKDTKQVKHHVKDDKVHPNHPIQQDHQLHFWIGMRRDWALMGGDDSSDEDKKHETDSWFWYYNNATQRLQLGDSAPWDEDEPYSQTNEREDCANIRITPDEAAFGTDPCRMELPFICQYFGPDLKEEKNDKRG